MLSSGLSARQILHSFFKKVSKKFFLFLGQRKTKDLVQIFLKVFNQPIQHGAGRWFGDVESFAKARKVLALKVLILAVHLQCHLHVAIQCSANDIVGR